MTERYMVWYEDDDGWRTYPPMSRTDADRVAKRLDEEGRSYRVVPAPRTTVEDLVE
jgi:hypothetical protein